MSKSWMYVGTRDHKNFPLNALHFLVLPAHTLMVKGFLPSTFNWFLNGKKLSFQEICCFMW